MYGEVLCHNEWIVESLMEHMKNNHKYKYISRGITKKNNNTINYKTMHLIFDL